MTNPNEPGKPDNNDKPQPAIPNQYSFLWLSAAFFLMFLWLQDTGRSLKEHRKELDALAKAVMKHETLSTEEITEVLSKAGDGKIA